VEDVQTANRDERNGDVQIEMRGLYIIHAQAVQQYKRLLERCAAHRDVGHHASPGPLLNVYRRIGAKIILHILKGQGMLLRIDCNHGARGITQTDRRYAAQNEHCLLYRRHRLLRLLRLSFNCDEQHKQKEAYSPYDSIADILFQ
jgi:hypothetical protein